MLEALPLLLYVVLLTLLAPPLGRAIWRWCDRQPAAATSKLVGRLGIDCREQTASSYLAALLWFNALGILLLTLVLLGQHLLPGSYADQPPAWSWHLAFNTAVSFVTNSNWQAYSGELQLSPWAQAIGLTLQNFLSAATGLAVLLALLRGISRQNAATVGNFWLDLGRGTVLVLLPLALLLALLLVADGVPQTLSASASALLSDGSSQTIPLGQVASQVAIKQLGTNGGGFYGVNSAFPLENPSSWSNLLECLAILLIPAALVFTLGQASGARRHAWLLYLLQLLWVVAGVALVWWAEAQPDLTLAGLTLNPGHWEGKESRFGIALSSLWSVVTTAASNGSVNAMHDSFSSLGGVVPLFNIMLGGVIFGGIGSGLYGLFLYVLLTAFLAALMIGRSADYLGKRIGAYELKATLFGLLMMPIGVLGCGALAWYLPDAREAITNPGVHGLSQWLYNYSSAAGNNGSAFAGFLADRPVHNLLQALAMLIGRFGVIVPVLLIAGNLAAKPRSSEAVVPTDSLLFAVLLVVVLLVVGGLNFFPAIALGPVAEWLMVYP